MNEREEKKVSIELCGKTFEISSHLSMNDMKIYFDVLENEKDAKRALVAVIYHKLQKYELSIPTEDEVFFENDSIFEEYIINVIDNSHTLRAFYQKADISLPIIERFASANKQYLTNCKKNIVEVMQPTLKMMDQIRESINISWLNNMQQIVRQTAKILEPIRNMMAQFASTFANAIANIQVPTYTEERKRELVESYKIWGKMGWSVIPHAPFKLFNQAPANIKDADRIALQYFDKKGMKDLFTRLEEKTIRKEDINSAIFCFDNKQYKACALLLFGIIDAKLIRLQPSKKGGKRREVGKGAVKVLEAKYKEKGNAEEFLYHVLYSTGLLESLNTFFASGNDFREEPLVINRNFVDHGMNRRNVRRKDCIKLFLALYNLTELLEDL